MDLFDFRLHAARQGHHLFARLDGAGADAPGIAAEVEVGLVTAEMSNCKPLTPRL